MFFGRSRIEAIVLAAIRRMNEVRDDGKRIPERPDALLDVRGVLPAVQTTSLDSLDLMTLLIEVDDGLRMVGVEIDLSDPDTLACEPYPLRSVATLVDHIQRRVASDWSAN